MRCVYYAIVVDPQAAYERRWIRSICSLRRFNPRIPVHLYVFDKPANSLREAADQYKVSLEICGDYRDFLGEFAGAEHAGLSCMPTLQKLLPLRLIGSDVSRILYLDCDTFFFGDVESLFDKYRASDWYGREEPSSRQSVLFPYEPRHIDEDVLSGLSAVLKRKSVPPHNLGVFLFNDRVRSTLLARRKDFFTLIWRLAAGATREPSVKVPSELRRQTSEWLASPCNEPLKYPSRNFWIVDQVALWLTLGGNPELSHGFFAAEDVLQGPEFLFFRSYTKWCTVAHYYSCNESLFFTRARVDH